MKSAALAVSVLSFAGVVLAQSTTTTGSASATTSANASSGTRSAQCNDFLSKLDNDQDVSSCLNALIGATSDFDPSNTANAGNSSSAAITAALDKICPSSFIACNESKIRLTLTNFYTQCQVELLGANGTGTDGHKDVVDTYDVLYLLVPLKNAICSKDIDGKYCVNKMATPTSASTSRTATGSSASSSATHARRYIEPYKRELVARAPGDSTNSTGQLTLGGLGQQSTQMNNDGLPYLFMTTNTTDAELCTQCTAEVVGAYIAFEDVTPYALGLSRSPILGGQIKLWQRLRLCNGGQLVRDILANNTGTSSQYNSALVDVSVNTWLAGGAALLLGAIALF